jgi:aminoglycoside 2'-N-acetyltransferase I
VVYVELLYAAAFEAYRATWEAMKAATYAVFAAVPLDYNDTVFEALRIDAANNQAVRSALEQEGLWREGDPEPSAYVPSKTVELDLRLVRDLSEADHRELRELLERVHGPPEAWQELPAGQLRFARVDPDADHAIRVWEDGQLVSTLVGMERAILVDERRTRAGGIRGVRTHPEYRRRGFASAAMRRATDVLWQDRRVELGLLLSSEMAVPFYRSLGWKVIKGPVLCEGPDGGVFNYTERLPQCPAMVLVPAAGQLPVGTVDLCGLPW